MAPADTTSPPGKAQAVYKQRFTALDASLMACFDGVLRSAEQIRDKRSLTISLSSCDADGWPVTTLLGVGEILAHTPQHLSLALWPGSRAHAALSRTGQAVLSFVFDGRFFQIRAGATPGTGITVADGLAIHSVQLIEGEGQRVPYAHLVSGILFRLEDEAATLAAWRRQIALMRDLTRVVTSDASG